MSKNKQPSVSTKVSGQVKSKVEKGKKGKPKIHNNLVKDYFRSNPIYADLVSGFFNVEIDPDSISDCDTTLEMNDEIIKDNTRFFISKELIRDIAKMIKDNKGNKCQICVEDQTRYDKHMPIRVLMYDSMAYYSMIEKNEYIPTFTLVCNWDKRKYPENLPLSSLFKSPFSNAFDASMIKLNLAVFNVVDYIYNQDKYSFKSELRYVFAYVSGALNNMSIEEIKERCPWIKGQKISKLGLSIINLYMKIDVDIDGLEEEENDMASIYQEKINEESAKARVKGLNEGRAVGRAEGMAEGGIEKTYEIALTLSKLYKRSFESMLDDFNATPEVREICMEKYRKNVG